MQQSRLTRIERSVLIVVIQRSGAASHPNVIVRIDEDAAHLAEHPIVRQLLRPVWIRFELRHILTRRRSRQGRKKRLRPGCVEFMRDLLRITLLVCGPEYFLRLGV